MLQKIIIAMLAVDLMLFTDTSLELSILLFEVFVLLSITSHKRVYELLIINIEVYSLLIKLSNSNEVYLLLAELVIVIYLIYQLVKKNEKLKIAINTVILKKK